MTGTAGGNEQQIEFWNGEGGKRWVRQNQVLDAFILPIGEAALDAAAPAARERAIDIGCGCGNQTLALARRIGPGGHVLGIDVSEPMLAVARELAATDRAGRADTEFLCADASAYGFEPAGRDLLFSRFGTMFFADPVTAFTNLRSALRPDGRLALCCWRTMQENESMTLPLAAALNHVPPPEPVPPDAPGPFAFADRARVLDILNGAGFRQAAVDPLDCPLRFGAGFDAHEIAQRLLQIGPASRVLTGASEETFARVAQDLYTRIAPRCEAAGLAFMARCWLVTARR